MMSDTPAARNLVRRKSPLAAVFEKMGANVESHDGWDTVPHFTSPEREAQVVRQAVGLSDLSSISKFDVRGINLAVPPELSDDARAWRLRYRQMLVTCGAAAHDAVQQQLARYAEAANESAPVYVTEVTPVYAALLLAGPHSEALLRKLVDVDVAEEALPNLSCVQSGIHHVHVLVVRQDVAACRAYLLLGGREYGEWLWESVMHAGHEFGIEPFGSRAHDLLGAA